MELRSAPGVSTWTSVQVLARGVWAGGVFRPGEELHIEIPMSLPCITLCWAPRGKVDCQVFSAGLTWSDPSSPTSLVISHMTRRFKELGP